MKKDVGFEEYAPQLLKQLKQGVFLAVRDGDGANIMTIGWGSIGFVWGRPVFTVLVRYSRYTYELIEKAGEFTVSVPLKNNLKKELAYCGSKSGRDVDKFAECGLTPEPGKIVSTPVVKECSLFYECKVVCKQAMQPAFVEEDIVGKFYQDSNYHVVYHGEIVASYINE